MTFTEAAVEVLRLVGKPLHYKKITEVAIERNLLSHVGKTPEVTMSSRLATMVKRDRGEAPIIKVKPGVFGLREFNEEQLADLSGDVDELPEVEVENEQDKAADAHEGALDVPSIAPSIEPRKPLPGADVFPEEDDDDEPILGGDDDDDDDEEAEGEEGARTDAQPGSESRSSRRRRKRRRRGGPEEAAEPEVRAVREPREEAPRPLREAREPRGAREPRRDDHRREERARERGPDLRHERPERHPERHPERNERILDRPRDDRRFERDEPDFQREPGDGDLLGKDLADAVASVLTQGGPRGLPAMRIADLLVRKGRLSGDPSQLVPTIMAAVRADIARKRVEQTRARFRVEGGVVVLTEFLLPQDVVRAELDVVRAAERQRERTRRAFLRKLSELPGAGMAELIATWLNAEGVVGLRAVRRPGAGVGELHLAGTLRRGADEVRLAIVVYREARELSRERVIEARGSLHYYGNASTSWLVTFGSVTSGAREEASAPAAGPVSLYDGLSLATAMERQGVGLVTQSVAISALDYELLEALRGGQSMREAPRDLDQERGRGVDHERGRGRDRDANRNERDRDAGRGAERERPRLTLERKPRELEEEIDVEQVEEEGEDDVALDESDEVIEAVLQEAGVPGADTSTEEGEAREGGRRRRRRRRRKGGRVGEAGEAQAGDASAQGEGDESQEPREESSWGEGEEPESEPGEPGEREEREERDDYARADDERADRYLDDEDGNSGESLAPRASTEAGARDERERAHDDDQDGEEDAQDDDDGDDDLDDESSDRAHESTTTEEGDEPTHADDNRAGGERRHESDAAPRGQDDDSQDPYSGRRGHG